MRTQSRRTARTSSWPAEATSSLQRGSGQSSSSTRVGTRHTCSTGSAGRPIAPARRRASTARRTRGTTRSSRHWMSECSMVQMQQTSSIRPRSSVCTQSTARGAVQPFIVEFEHRELHRGAKPAEATVSRWAHTGSRARRHCRSLALAGPVARPRQFGAAQPRRGECLAELSWGGGYWL